MIRHDHPGNLTARLAALALMAGVAACDDGASATGPGEMTAGEEAALDDAAYMLDTRPGEPAPEDPPADGDGYN
ncbi:hypothetical protein OZN62_08555 [Aurantiacibacter sp. MUD11]|uniref:hypothetical protein n=1 Tax=Aurantiacibacter sp. MUD11 TaxID=3003265 RepID=UPI0022AB0157|nr:hypothetical protein [Aurantiacibacter sp. MUD11]WAT16991.1 hypothetical protein OZN62_08555 [Aurantiacibacter sp. MUD11]